MTMMNLADIRKQIAETTEALAKADTELKWELAASAADVAGMVDPTPTSDLIGAGLAVRKGDWFGAGMSVASMVPYVGDALAKPAKAVRAAKKINALRETLAKMTAKLAELKKAEKQAEAAEAAVKEAKIAKETAEGAAEKSRKQSADSQKESAKAGENKDCEDCSSGGGKQPGNANDGGTKGANSIGVPATRSANPLSSVLERDLHGNEIMYRTMSEKQFEQFSRTGKLPPTTETSISPSVGYSSKYDGVTVKITVAPGTSAQLQEIGIAANKPAAAQFPNMSTQTGSWMQTNARFKVEGGQMTTQLGQGKAIDIFNQNIVDFGLVPK